MASTDASSKQVIDEVSGYLRILKDGTVDRTWTGPPEALFLMNPVPPNGITVHDLPTDPPLRLYLPEQVATNQQNDNSNKLPILLHFIGGGFCITHASWFMYHQFYTRLANSIPAIIVSPYLPLAPEHRLPAAIDVSYNAFQWLRSLGRLENNLLKETTLSSLSTEPDFTRVFLIGDSSGGNIVHQVAARAGAETEEECCSPVKLAGGIMMNPGFARSTRSRSELELKSNAFFSLDMLDKFLALGLPEGATKDHPITCPMGEAAPNMEELKLPPFLVVVSDGDLILDTNLEYCEAMKKAGKDVEVVMTEGVGHSFYLNKLDVDFNPVTAKRTEELILKIKDFVDRH